MGTVRAVAAMIARFSFVAAASAGMLGPAQAAHPDGTPDRPAAWAWALTT